jgi:hypothetical protein
MVDQNCLLYRYGLRFARSTASRMRVTAIAATPRELLHSSFSFKPRSFLFHLRNHLHKLKTPTRNFPPKFAPLRTDSDFGTIPTSTRQGTAEAAQGRGNPALAFSETP